MKIDKSNRSDILPPTETEVSGRVAKSGDDTILGQPRQWPCLYKDKCGDSESRVIVSKDRFLNDIL